MADPSHLVAASDAGDDAVAAGGDTSDDPDHLVPVFSLHRRSYSSSSSDAAAVDDALPFDLFSHRRRISGVSMDPFPEPLHQPGFRVSSEIQPDYLELGLGLGLGFGSDGEIEDDGEREVVVSDWAPVEDDFFVDRGRPRPQSSTGPIDSSRARHVVSEALRVSGFVSDSDSDSVGIGDEQIVAIGDNSDGNGMGIPVCWDCLHLDENHRESNEDFEWEEVDGRVEEGDVVSGSAAAAAAIGNEEGPEEVGVLYDVELENEEEDVDSTIAWEVLLATHNWGRNAMGPDDVEAYFVDDQEGFVYTSQIEAFQVLIGQFAEQDGNIKGSPPAAKSVVENLPSVVFSEEDVASQGTVCAVCKDVIVVEDKLKRLPCSHHYHEGCILPWLQIRNTCPLCRFELPTDDPEYENWKARVAAGVDPEGEAFDDEASDDEAGNRYDFELLPD